VASIQFPRRVKIGSGRRGIPGFKVLNNTVHEGDLK